MQNPEMEFQSFEAFCRANGYNFMDWLHHLGKRHGVDYVEMSMRDNAQLSNIYRERTSHDKLKYFANMTLESHVMTEEESKYWRNVSRHWILYLEINGARSQFWDRAKLNPIELFEIDIIAQASNNTRKNMGQAYNFDEGMI